MEIEVHHRCKPEFQGDAQPEIHIDSSHVWLTMEKSRVNLTHDQFKEIVRAYNGYVQGNITAQEQIKDVPHTDEMEPPAGLRQSD